MLLLKAIWGWGLLGCTKGDEGRPGGQFELALEAEKKPEGLEVSMDRVLKKEPDRNSNSLRLLFSSRTSTLRRVTQDLQREKSK